MTDLPAQIVVIAKEPIPGRVKTRLTPPFSPREAAMLAEAARVARLAPASRFAATLAATLGAPAEPDEQEVFDWAPALVTR